MLLSFGNFVADSLNYCRVKITWQKLHRAVVGFGFGLLTM